MTKKFDSKFEEDTMKEVEARLVSRVEREIIDVSELPSEIRWMDKCIPLTTKQAKALNKKIEVIALHSDGSDSVPVDDDFWDDYPSDKTFPEIDTIFLLETE